ncbi:hypothetical protein I4U23_004722 [Adineta vaga]|nr:hypothetical protein I4U23_004722 [Adineta vaga]
MLKMLSPTLTDEDRRRRVYDGERKRLAFASVALTDPSIMLIGEPTSNLDLCLAKPLIALVKTLISSIILALLYFNLPHGMPLHAYTNNVNGLLYLVIYITATTCGRLVSGTIPNDILIFLKETQHLVSTSGASAALGAFIASTSSSVESAVSTTVPVLQIFVVFLQV